MCEDPEGENSLNLIATLLFRNSAGNLMIVTGSDTEHDAADKVTEAMITEEVQDLIARIQEDFQQTRTTVSQTDPQQDETESRELQPLDPSLEFIFPDSNQRYLSD